jgi:hypothetical protein
MYKDHFFSECPQGSGEDVTSKIVSEFPARDPLRPFSSLLEN